jgi:hypothetical protein
MTYLRIIKSDDMRWTGSHGNVLEGEITEYNDLREIIRPNKNGTGRRQERVVLKHNDGTTQTVTGHIVGSGSE